jgi:hypothetical protein
MDYKKSLVVFVILFALAIEVQTIRQSQDHLKNSMLKTNTEINLSLLFSVMNIGIERRIRSFGCKGPSRRNEYLCRLHCRSEGYKTGSCSRFTNFQDCVCFKSSFSQSKNMKFFPVFLNISRL